MADTSFHDRKIPTFEFNSSDPKRHSWLTINIGRESVIIHFDSREPLEQIISNMKEAIDAF